MKIFVRVVLILVVVVGIAAGAFSWYINSLSKRYMQNLTCADLVQGLKEFRDTDDKKKSTAEEMRTTMAVTTAMLYAKLSTGIPNVILDEAMLAKQMNEINNVCKANPGFRVGQIYEEPADFYLTNSAGLNAAVKRMLLNLNSVDDPEITSLAKFISGTYKQANAYQNHDKSSSFSTLDYHPQQQ